MRISYFWSDRAKSAPQEPRRSVGEKGRSERRRSTRIEVQVPVRAHFEDLDGQEVLLDVFTLAVSAHGCLFAMNVRPAEGQRLRLRSARSAVEQAGRIVQVQRTREGYFAVAFEFDTPNPNLWPILDPPGDWMVRVG
jgi:hypothetical protein